MFDRVASNRLDHEALVSRHQHLRYAYRQLHEVVDQCARGLLALGIQSGTEWGCGRPITRSG
jgi:fatty-acyl-CoA synthase